MNGIRGLNLPLLRRMARRLADEICGRGSREIGVYFVGRKKIAELNERFLQHQGPTDVITFDYGEEALRGEIFICAPEAASQAEAFGTTAQMELVRYLVHGLLHLKGYDDRTAKARQRMKRVEDRWVRWLERNFECEKVWSRKRRA